MMRIFISRKLDPGSPLTSFALEKNVEVHGESLLDYNAIDLKELPKEDFLFFSSKNGVRFYFEQLNQVDKKTYGAIGPATAIELNKFGVIPQFVGSGQSPEVGVSLLTYLDGQSVAFISGTHFSPIIEDILSKESVTVVRYFVYEQIPTYPAMTEFYDIYVFTSPLNWNSFYRKNDIPPTAKVYAMGQTTLAAMAKDLDDRNIYIPKNPTEKEICLALEEWI